MQPRTPRVSIVIPVYNGANYMREAIDSALAQTYADVEVVVVNDGSTDGGETDRIARSYGDRIRYVAKPNGGVATALNAGIEAMTGEYFSWLSHDDVYLPEKVAAQVEHLQRLGTPRAVVYGPFEEIDERSAVLPRPGIGQRVHDDPLMAVFATVLHGCTLLVPREAFERAGLFNPALRSTQDNEMWLRIAMAGFPFHRLPRVLVQSRQHAEQGSRTMDSHAAEREEWYLWAIDAIGAEARRRHAGEIAEILLRFGHVRSFARLARRLREDGGGVGPLVPAVGRSIPVVVRSGGTRALRRLPGVLWLKRKLFPAGAPRAEAA